MVLPFSRAVGTTSTRSSKFHQDTEREEQKRMERVSKERLRALKNDDEEAYLKLVDTAKDMRITHLLK